MNRTLKFALAGLFILGFLIGTGVGLTIIQLSPEYISLYQNSYAPSNFRIDDFATLCIGSNKIVITIILKNTDTATHSANVTVFLFDSTDHVIARKSKLTGDVAGGGNVILVYTFTGNNIVEEYDHAFIQIKDLS